MRRRKPQSRVLAVMVASIFAIATTGPVAADVIYKWTDEKGTVHYGERPPEGVNAERVLVSAAPEPEQVDDPYAAARITPEQRNEAQQQREEERLLAEQREQEEARIAAACEAQKARLAELIPRAKVILQNPDGTSRMLDDEERLAMIEESQKFVDENCD